MNKHRYKTLTEFVVDDIKEQILSGTLAGGETIRQGLIAERLEVSRIPVREALAQLESQGLVKVLPHKGAIVREVSTEEIDELFTLRSIIEPHVLESAIPRLNDQHFEQAESVLEALETALGLKKDIPQWSKLNHDFHMSLYTPSNKTHSLEIISTLNTRSDRYIRIQLLYTDGIKTAETEHRELLKLCRDNNIPSATKLLRDHIVNAGKEAMTLFKDKIEP